MCLHEGRADGKLAAQEEKCFVFGFSGVKRDFWVERQHQCILCRCMIMMVIYIYIYSKIHRKIKLTV